MISFKLSSLFAIFDPVTHYLLVRDMSCLCLFCFNFPSLLVLSRNVTVKTELGWITGNLVKSKHGGDTICKFLGIRYDVTPVRILRFSPASTYTRPNSYKCDATKYGDVCYQQNAL